MPFELIEQVLPFFQFAARFGEMLCFNWHNYKGMEEKAIGRQGDDDSTCTMLENDAWICSGKHRRAQCWMPAPLSINTACGNAGHTRGLK